MNSQLSKLDKILSDIEAKASRLDSFIKQKQSKYRKTPALIESDYFNGTSAYFSYYLKQTRLNRQYLAYALENKDEVKTRSLLESLENQIHALSNALLAEDTRQKGSKFSPKRALEAMKKGAAQKSQSYELYERLSEYRGYEQRLENMLDEHIKALKINSKKNAFLDPKTKALHQRLANCRKAILGVELSIQKLEKQYK